MFIAGKRLTQLAVFKLVNAEIAELQQASNKITDLDVRSKNPYFMIEEPA